MEDQGPWWIAIAAALLAFFGTAVTALLARSSARASADAATAVADITSGAGTFVPTSERFANWQMYKRKIYAELLSAIRAAQLDPRPEAVAEMHGHFDMALLTASVELRQLLLQLRRKITAGEVAANDEEYLDVIITKMHADIG